MAARSEVRKLIAQLEQQGFEVALMNSGHFRVRNPETGRKVSISQTPSDKRTLLNDTCRLTRIGFVRVRTTR